MFGPLYYLADHRQRFGASVEDLARVSGVSAATIYRAEDPRGIKVRKETAERLARVLNTTPERLRDG